MLFFKSPYSSFLCYTFKVNTSLCDLRESISDRYIYFVLFSYSFKWHQVKNRVNFFSVLERAGVLIELYSNGNVSKNLFTIDNKKTTKRYHEINPPNSNYFFLAKILPPRASNTDVQPALSYHLVQSACIASREFETWSCTPCILNVARPSLSSSPSCGTPALSAHQNPFVSYHNVAFLGRNSKPCPPCTGSPCDQYASHISYSCKMSCVPSGRSPFSFFFFFFWVLLLLLGVSGWKKTTSGITKISLARHKIDTCGTQKMTVCARYLDIHQHISLTKRIQSFVVEWLWL